MCNSCDTLAVGELRALARGNPKRVRQHNRATRRVVRWVRRNKRANDAAIARRVEREARLSALQAACRAHGLPDPVSLDDPYTGYGRRWHRRFLAKTLDSCGFTPGNLDRLVYLAWGTVRWDNSQAVVAVATRLANFAGSDNVGDDDVSKAVAKTVRKQLAVEPPKQRTHYAWLRRLAVVHAEVAAALEPLEDLETVGHLTFVERCLLAMSGLHSTPSETDDDRSWVAAAAVLLATGSDGLAPSVAERRARAIDGDVTKARILQANSRLSPVKLAKTGRHEALVEHGTATLVAYAHLRQTSLACRAPDVAAAFMPIGADQVGPSEPATAIRRLAVRPLVDLLAETDVPTRDDVVAATRIVAGFGRRTRDYLRAVHTAAGRHRRPVPSARKLGEWLPGDLDPSFVSWFLAHGRVQAVLTAKGRAQLATIALSFGELRSDEQNLTVPETAVKLRLRGYGPVGETAFGAVCAEIGVSPDHANRVAERWNKALSTPSFLPTVARFTDASTGLVGRFLPRDDPRGLWLGLITDCCQYPSSAGETCAWAGHENPLMGFFVIEDGRRRVVAQSWVWSDGAGGICFDSVERKSLGHSLADSASRGDQRRARAFRKIYRKAAKHLCDWFDIVNVGPAWGLGELTERAATKELSPAGYNGYRDSHNQRQLAARGKPDEDTLTVRSYRNGWKLVSGSETLATVTATGATVRSGDPDHVRSLFVDFGHDVDRLAFPAPSSSFTPAS